jgi:hypothetical protein
MSVPLLSSVVFVGPVCHQQVLVERAWIIGFDQGLHLWTFECECYGVVAMTKMSGTRTRPMVISVSSV